MWKSLLLLWKSSAQESMANRQHFHTKLMLAEPRNLRVDWGKQSCILWFCRNGGKPGGNAALKAMLTYIQDSREENVTDEATAELHDYVNRAKVMPEVKNAYMRLEEFIYYQRKEEREEAVIDTMVQGILDLLEDCGDIPDRVVKRLKETKDKATLKRWHKLAAKSNSIEEFEESMSLDSVPQ